MSSPLPSVDALGRMVTPGARVKVNSVASCLTELPPEDQARLRQCVGTLMVVSEIDKYGFVWLARAGESAFFCLKPEEVELA
jgi:hypothetical protein